MKTNFVRAAVVACLPFCAMALTVATTPAFAADKSKDGPKPSKAASKLIEACVKALDSKDKKLTPDDYKNGIARCSEVVALAEATDYDKYIGDRYLAVAYLNVNDYANSGVHFAAVVKNPACPEEDIVKLIGPAMMLASQNNNNPLVLELGAIAAQRNIVNRDVYQTMAQAYFQGNDLPNAMSFALKGVELAEQQKVVPEYQLLQIYTYSAEKLKDMPAEMKGLNLMARDHGKPNDWRFLLNLSLESLPGKDPNIRKIASLHLYRLRLIVGATWEPTNYLEAIDAADSAKTFGDVRTFLQMGTDANAFPASKAAPLVARNNATIAKDKGVLDSVEKMVKDSKGLASVAESHYGYGNYAEAARVAQKAIAAGGTYAAEGKLVLAMAQIKMGKDADAKATLAGFTGDPAFARVADLLNLYLDRRYGDKAPVAPAAAQ